MDAKKPFTTVHRGNAMLNQKENVDPEGVKDDNHTFAIELAELKKMMGTLLKLQAKSIILMEQILKREQKNINFPIKTLIDLERTNDDIKDNPDSYVPAIKSIIGCKGITKSLNNLFSNELITQINYDGVKGKVPFKDFKNLGKAIFDACNTYGYCDKAHSVAMKKAFKLAKGRFYKRESLKRKAECEVNCDDKSFSKTA